MGQSAQVTLQIEGISKLRKLQSILDPKAYERIAKRAIKQAGSTAKTQIAKGIRQRYTISSARIKEDISGPFFSQDTATILAKKAPPTANQYKFREGTRGRQPGLGRGRGWGPANPPGRPASYQVFRARPAKPVPAFLAKGLPTIRIRKEKGKGSLKVLKGPSIGRIFAGRGVFARELQRETKEKVNESFLKSFEKGWNDRARGFG
jgi:hypothetical protein